MQFFAVISVILMRKKNLYFILFLFLPLISCVETPEKPDNSILRDGNIAVLCEGLMAYNNATLCLINTETGESDKEFFRTVNPGMTLGDTGNDLLYFGDKLIITVTGSESIVLLDAADGSFISRVDLPGRHPNKTIGINDTLALASDLYNDSALICYNQKTGKRLPDMLFEGKNPVDILKIGNQIAVANSGLGIYFQDHPLAGTISLINLETGRTEKHIKVGPNLSELLLAENELIACYYGIYSDESRGGIVRYSLDDFTEISRIEGFFSSMVYSEKSDRLHFLEGVAGMDISEHSGVSYIDLKDSEPKIQRIIENKNDKECFYSLAVDESNNQIIVGNAKNFTVEGTIMIFDMNGEFVQEYSCGVNPGEILLKPQNR